MKQLIFIILFALPVCCMAQADTTNYEAKAKYCILTVVSKVFSSKVTAIVDYGQPADLGSDRHLKDERGKNLDFNSEMDAVNYLDAQGWELINYVQPHDENPRYLFRRKKQR